MKRLLVLLAAMVLLPAASAAAIDTNAGTETVTSGAVTAQLSWGAGETPLDATLTITRGGVQAFHQLIPNMCGSDCLLFPEDDADFQAVDLNGDREPEIVMDGGDLDVPCCGQIGVFEYQPATGTYHEYYHAFHSSWNLRPIHGGPGIVIQDGRFDAINRDDEFSYSPVRVYRYEHSALADVTKQARGPVSTDAGVERFFIEDFKPGHHDHARSIVAAYVADEYLLGRGARGLKMFDRQAALGYLGKPKAAAAYRRKLLALLDRIGYR